MCENLFLIVRWSSNISPVGGPDLENEEINAHRLGDGRWSDGESLEGAVIVHTYFTRFFSFSRSRIDFTCDRYVIYEQSPLTLHTQATYYRPLHV